MVFKDTILSIKGFEPVLHFDPALVFEKNNNKKLCGSCSDHLALLFRAKFSKIMNNYPTTA
jgi:hypothetical protein